jgi:hypothetical protein
MAYSCVCDGGWVGDACTCPVPRNIADGLLVQTLPGSATVFVDLVNPAFVTRVEVSQNMRGVLLGNLRACGPVGVSLAGTATGGSAVSCALGVIDGVARWACPATPLGKRFVLVQGSVALPNCLVRVFTDDTPACGLPSRVNPFAGRFFASPVFEAPWNYSDVQPSALAAGGCTDFGCMCGPDFTGPLCTAGISAVSQDPDGLFSAKLVGETVLPRRGFFNPATGLTKCLSVTFASLVSSGGLPKGTYDHDACECSSWYILLSLSPSPSPSFPPSLPSVRGDVPPLLRTSEKGGSRP